MRKPEHILLQGVVGSQAYGMSTDYSDVDTGGVYAADPMHLLDLTIAKPEEPTYTQKAPQPDMWLHEAKKICRLALNGNPTSSEIMWLDEYEIKTEWGQALIDIRHSFLSYGRLRHGYFGFATGQLHRYFGYDKTTEDGRKHAAKNARHLWRLLYQGYWAAMGDGLVVKLEPDIAALAREFGERAAGTDKTPPDPELVQREIARYEKLFDELRSPLPEYPDNTLARECLHDLRLSMI